MRPWVLALLLASAPGCDRLLAIENLPLPTVDGGAPVAVNAACVECADSQCSDLRGACDSDTRCSALVSCLNRCAVNDLACRATCERNSSGASALRSFLDYDACRRKKCVGVCYGTKGLLASLGANCACADDRCEAQALACVQSELERGGPSIGSCERRIACMAGRANPDVFVECDPLDGGQEEFKKLRDCARRTLCSTDGKACMMSEGDLSCVDKFRYGATVENQITATVRLGKMTADDLSHFPPVKGATVRACPAGQCATCPATSPVGTTDGEGAAPVRVSTALGVYTGCFRITPPTPGPGETSDLPEVLLFSGRKLHLDEDVMWTLMIDKSVVSLIGGADGDVDWVNRGHVIGTLHDCLWGRTVGATLELSPPADDKVLAYYMDESGVVRGATATGVTGGFAFLNVPPGKRTVIAKKGGVEIARLDIEVVAGTLGDANVYPRPLP